MTVPNPATKVKNCQALAPVRLDSVATVPDKSVQLAQWLASTHHQLV